MVLVGVEIRVVLLVVPWLVADVMLELVALVVLGCVTELV